MVGWREGGIEGKKEWGIPCSRGFRLVVNCLITVDEGFLGVEPWASLKRVGCLVSRGGWGGGREGVCVLSIFLIPSCRSGRRMNERINVYIAVTLISFLRQT